MIKIRLGAFETNSSSVHTLILCSDEEYQAFNKHELYYDTNKNVFITYTEAREKLIQIYKEWPTYIEEEWREMEYEEPFSIEAFDKLSLEEREQFFNSMINAYSADSYFENKYYETFDDEYTTKSGEIVHAFGYYGHDY